jgi:hypothetical protein
MSEGHSVSRRASLKSLGVIGAAVVFGGAASAQVPAESKPAGSAKDKPPVNVVDLAADRFAKGHS